MNCKNVKKDKNKIGIGPRDKEKLFKRHFCSMRHGKNINLVFNLRNLKHFTANIWGWGWSSERSKKWDFCICTE